MLRNTASQYFLVGPLLLTADGTEQTSGASIFLGSSSTSGGGTLTHYGNGVWRYAPTQTETNVDRITGYLYRANCPPVVFDIPTTTFPFTTSGVIPAVAAGANNGLPLGDDQGRVLLQTSQPGVTIPTVTAVTNGVSLAANQDVRNVSGDVSGKVLGGGSGTITGTGVRAVDGSGNAIAPASTALSTAQWTNTRAGLLDNLDAAVSTRSTLTQTQVTGGAYSIASTLCVLGDTRIANLDAAVSTRSTYAGADTSGTTTLLTRLSSTRAGYLDNLAVAPLTSLGTNAPTGWIDSAAFAAGATLPRVTLVDTTTTNTDMLTATAVWSAATRTLTSAGSGGATAQEVWEYATRTLTSGGGGGLTASDVWSHATRTLTAGTNIVLAKGTGVTGFNDLDAAGVRGAVGLAAANLDTQIGDIPNNSEFNARTLASGSYATVAGVAAQIIADHGSGSYVRNTEPLDAAGTRTALGLSSANLDTQLADLPTNAELAIALAGADDATLAAIAALNNVSAAQVLSAIQGWTVETGRTFSDVVKGIAAALIGDVVGNGATYRGFGVATTRLSVTSDSDGNRTITYTG
jgi:hypothetical protein